MRYSNSNGKMIPANEAYAAADNTAMRYGVGLFETMLVRNGTVQLADYHMERLVSGMVTLGFPPPALFTPDYLLGEALRTVRKCGWQALCRVRLQVYWGAGGIAGPESNKPYYQIDCYGLEAHQTELNEHGLVVGLASGIAKSADTLSNLKSCNALVYAMASKQAHLHKWNDALICNTAGHIIESTIANIFWVEGDKIFTPPLTEGCVAGVMRRHLLQLVPDIAEMPLTSERLLMADEVFVTNAIRGVRWIGAIEDKKYGSAYARKVAALLKR